MVQTIWGTGPGVWTYKITEYAHVTDGHHSFVTFSLFAFFLSPSPPHPLPLHWFVTQDTENALNMSV